MSDIIALKMRYPLVMGEQDPTLRTVCTEVSTITSDIEQLHHALEVLLREYEGVGLAAPQIGQTVRMCAVTQRDMSQKKWELEQEIIMINPVIVGTSDATEIEEEGCLSLPGVTGKVQRPTDITVKYMTIDGKDHILKSSGYNARIIQHEIDHLDGVLFIDKLV